MAGPLKAQDTIPFLDPSLGHQLFQQVLPPHTLFPTDTVLYYQLRVWVPAGKYITLHNRYKVSYGATVCGIAITADSCFLAQEVKCSLLSYNDNDGFVYYDSINTESSIYRKKMYYDYNSVNDYYVSSGIVPCYIFPFDKVTLCDTTLYAKIEVENNYYGNYYNGCDCYYVSLKRPSGISDVNLGFASFPYGSGDGGCIFPVFQLPCPAPRVSVGTNFSGRVEFHWNPGGDTMLYQLAFHSADNGRLMFETDTLTDTTFTLVDSIAPAEMVNGRYEVRVRKACDYTGAPIANPLVWSDWSEPRTFNYMHRVEGIEDIESFGPQFTLSPNPAKGTVTVEGAADGERVEIVDMEGRVVIGERPLAGSPSTVDISHLTPGVYLVRLSSELGTATRKLVVE